MSITLSIRQPIKVLMNVSTLVQHPFSWREYAFMEFRHCTVSRPESFNHTSTSIQWTPAGALIGNNRVSPLSCSRDRYLSRIPLFNNDSSMTWWRMSSNAVRMSKDSTYSGLPHCTDRCSDCLNNSVTKAVLQHLFTCTRRYTTKAYCEKEVPGLGSLQSVQKNSK